MTGESRRDESVNFSLKELLRIEDERLEQQNREREAREAAEVHAREEAQRRERELLAAKERSAVQARAEEERQELEALAKREAMQKAIVEQARLEVEVRARTDERERERRHELELAQLRTDAKTKRPAGASIGSGLVGVAVASVIATVAHFAIVKPIADARVALLQRDVAAAESRAGELDRRLDEQKRVIAELQAKLDSAVVAPVANVKPTSPSSTKLGPSSPPTKAPPPPVPKGNETPCNPLDPLACGRFK